MQTSRMASRGIRATPARRGQRKRQDEALLELAVMAAEREAQAEEQEEALIELAALTEGGE